MVISKKNFHFYGLRGGPQHASASKTAWFCFIFFTFLGSEGEVIAQWPPRRYARVAYNNYFRFLHGLARYISVCEQQVLNNITTFDAILRKMYCSLVYRCYESNNKLIFSLMTSECFINSSYYCIKTLQRISYFA